MGRSLRRIKNARPLIQKRKHKKPYAKTPLPKEITTQAPDIERKLGIEPKWNPEAHIEANYENMGFAADLHPASGRNRNKIDALAAKAAQVPDTDEEIDAGLDEDLKVAMAKQRSSGKATPKRPTQRQRVIVERLVAAHGSDIEAMVRDRKLNPMQHSQGQLLALIHSCEYWKGKTGVDFRAPVKSI